MLVSFLVLCMGAFAQEPTIEELLDATDDVARGASSKATITMEVKTKRFSRTMTMSAVSQGEERTLIRVLSPAKEAGVATLKIDDNMWNYLPKVDRTMKVPSGMMSNRWMGSHFTNDDLVKTNRLSDTYNYSVTHPPTEAEGYYGITLVPKPDAPVVWGKVVVEVFPNKIPKQVLYYNEQGELERTMRFEDIVEMGGKTLPKTMLLIPGDAPEEYTKIIYDKLEFDVELPKSTFTLQSLKP